jgi:tetratricopeptide (TPR) repeat protein
LFADHDAAVNSVAAGNNAYVINDFATAETSYGSAMTNDPTWAVPYNNRGLARFHLGNFSGADSDFDTSKGYDTNYVSTYLNKGKSLAAQKRFTEAIAELQAGLLINSNNAGLYFGLGWVYDELGMYPQAITNFTAALSLDANYHAARLCRGVSYAKLGAGSNAVPDFYQVINSVTNGDMAAAISAYDLQLLRGPGVPFVSTSAASNYVSGVFNFSTEQYTAAINNFSLAQAMDPNVPDIPWMAAWSYVGNGQQAFGNSWLQTAYALMESEVVRTLRGGEAIFVNGTTQGVAPLTLHLFRSAHDLAVRKTGPPKQEWTGPLYTDGTDGGAAVMLLNPVTVADFTVFGPVVDTDRDWLADSWEVAKFTNLARTPDGDEDHDGLPNLYEFWLSANPNSADTDGDRASDWQEYLAGTDPADAGSFLRLAATVSGANVVLSFLSAANKTYVIEYCDSPTSPKWWSLPGGTLSGNGSILTVSVASSAAANRFYRIWLVP